MGTVNAAELRDRLSDSLNQVAFGGERLVVMRHGRAIAVLIPVDAYHDLEAFEARVDEKDAEICRSRADDATVPLAEVLLDEQERCGQAVDPPNSTV